MGSNSAGYTSYKSLLQHVLSPDYDLGAIILSIDLEGKDASQIGIATLDAQSLFNPIINSSQKVRTKLFHQRTPEHVRRARGKWQVRYIFAESELFHDELQVIQKIFTTYKDRNIILLGHSINYDLDVFAKFGFRPEDYRIIGTLDTWEISKEILDRDFEFLVENVLKELGFTGMHFHNGENDANFTWTDQTPLRLGILLSIAMDSLPTCSSRLENKNNEIAALIRAQRQERRQSKVEWDKVDFQTRATSLEERIYRRPESQQKNTHGRIERVDLVLEKETIYIPPHVHAFEHFAASPHHWDHGSMMD